MNKLDPTKPVYVYRNLRHGRKAPPLYSVLQNGRVVDRRHTVTLHDVEFVVREGGRQKVLATGRKNVHAFVKGYVEDHDKPLALDFNASYRPQAGPYFTNNVGLPVFYAKTAQLASNGVTFNHGVE